MRLPVPIAIAAAALLLAGAAAPPSQPPIAGRWTEAADQTAPPPLCDLVFSANRSGSAGTVRYACPGKLLSAADRWTLRGRQLVIRTASGEYVMRFDRVDADHFHAELYPEGGRRYLDLTRAEP